MPSHSQQIAFLRQRRNDTSAGLYLINADGTGLRLLKDFVADNEVIHPLIDSSATIDWSPDGSMIVLRGLYILDVAQDSISWVFPGPQPAGSRPGRQMEP